MGLYETIKEAASRQGKSINQIEKDLGLPRSSIVKYNDHVPSVDKVAKIARYLNVSLDSLLPDNEGYYTKENTATTAQELFDNPEMQMLFDAAKDSKPEDLQMVADMLRRFKETNPNG